MIKLELSELQQMLKDNKIINIFVEDECYEVKPLANGKTKIETFTSIRITLKK